MEKIGYEITYRNSADTRKYLEEVYVRFGKLVKALGIPREPEKK